MLGTSSGSELRHYELAFRVLERIEGAGDLTGFRTALTSALAEVYGTRSTTFFVGRTAQLACADPDPTILGYTRPLLPEYRERWYPHDVFGATMSVRSLVATRVASLFELSGGTPENHSYVADYLQRHGIHSATAIYLDLNQDRKALVGLFDRDPDRIGAAEVASLRLLARPLALIARNLPDGAADDGSEAAVLARLTPRQAEVARLVSDGLSNAAIGDALCLHPASVKKYVTRILAVCGLRNRTELAIAARQNQVR